MEPGSYNFCYFGGMDLNTYANNIIDLKNADLAMREHLICTGALGNAYHPEMERLHKQNAAVLNKIINEIGYPTIDKVGEEAAEAAWLVIQHAIGQPVFMRKCKSLLQAAVEKKKANPLHLAYLTDRIAVFEEKPQLYGTQFDWDINGELSANTVDDLEKVDERRKAIGLNPLSEQTERMRNQAKLEKQLAPADFAERQNEMRQWKRKAGWIK